MNASELKRHVEQGGHVPHFFTRDTMRFFGDTMRNYGVRRATVTRASDGAQVDCWELYRRRPVKHNVCSSTYFDAQTFYRVHVARG